MAGVPEILEVSSALRFISLTDSVKKTAELLLEEFTGITPEEAKEFAIEAMEDSRYQAVVEADEARQETMAIRDKEQAAQAEADRQFVDNYCLMQQKKKPTTPEEYERYAKAIRRQLDKEEKEAAADNKEVEERFPECPVMPGVLSDLARSLYPSLPLEYKQAALFTHFGLLRSGIDTFGMEPHIQPRFYTVLVAQPNRGKSASINEAVAP
jgi:hypothetical protein